MRTKSLHKLFNFAHFRDTIGQITEPDGSVHIYLTGENDDEKTVIQKFTLRF